MDNKQKVFRSRISVLLSGLILAILAPMTVLMIINMSIPGLCVMGVSLLFFVSSITSHRYVISGNRLYLKSRSIPIGSASIEDIILVERTYDMIGAPAASLKRLRIRFKKGVVYSNRYTWQSAPNWLVSPAREKEFIEALKALNPDIYVRVYDKKGKWRFWDWDI